MCGIIGAIGTDNAFDLVIRGLKLMEGRGLDGYGYYDGQTLTTDSALNKLKPTSSNQVIGHQLHAIVKNIRQPLKGEGVLIINCEIYNWKQLKDKHNIDARNDSELALRLLDKHGIKVIKEFDGPFAFCYWNKGKVFLARDIIGIKPLWIKMEKKSLLFASEKKALEKQGYENIDELNPRTIIEYDLKSENIKEIKRSFFEITPINKESTEKIRQKISGLISNAVSKRVPDQKIGLLFSGGIDSVVIAKILKDLEVDFTCYTAGLKEPGLKGSEDIVWAKKASKFLGLKLKIKTVPLKDVEMYLKRIIPLIEDANVVKAGVALPFYLSCELAKSDGVRVIFSGLGSEEIFAGYERHLNSYDVNKECLHGLMQMHERDLYRDDVITMANNMEIRLPFLDKSLVEYSLKIPPEFKIDKKYKKKILRNVAQEIFSVPDDLSWRPKKAAQYGSGFDKAISKLTRKSKMKLKADYLRQFLGRKNKKLAALFSSGKDSMYAIYLMKKHNYDINCLITIKSENPDSYMFHTPNVDLTRSQAMAMGIPLIEQKTLGDKETELKEMRKAISKAKKDFKIEGIVTGAVFSNYQRERIEKVCDDLGLTVFSPLWHKDQEELMRELLRNGFKFIFSSIAGYGLDKTWLNKTIDNKDVDKLAKLHKKIGINIAGEGGEFESLVLDCPMFSKRIEILDHRIIEENENTARFVVKKSRLSSKI